MAIGIWFNRSGGGGSGGSGDYYTKIQSDLRYVKTFGDEAIDGQKTFNDQTYFGDSLSITGDIFGDIRIDDSFILLNANESANGVSSGFAGFEVERGTLNNSYLMFKENGVGDTDNRWVIDIGDGFEQVVLYNGIPDDIYINGELSVNNDLIVYYNLTFPNLTNSGVLVTDVSGNVIDSGIDITTIATSADIDNLQTQIDNIVSNSGTTIFINGQSVSTLELSGGINSSLIPSLSGVYDLGSISYPWNNLYVNDLFIDNLQIFDYLNTNVENLTSFASIVDLSNYTELTTTASISASLQSQINAIEPESTIIIGDDGISVIESPINTWTVSISADYATESLVQAISSSLDQNILNVSNDIQDLRTEVENVTADLQLQINNIVEESTTVTSTDGTIDINNVGYNFDLSVDDYISKTEVSNITGDFVLKTGDTITGNIDINNADLSINNGKLNIGTVQFESIIETNVDVNTIIDSIPTSSGNAIFWDVLVDNGTDFRASRLMAVWNDSATQLRFNELSTESIGDTSGITLEVSIFSGTEIRLKAVPSVGMWNIKLIRKLL